MKGARKLSPAVDRKLVAGNPQTRLRRYTNVGVNTSTDKLASKRNVSLGGNLNFDPDSSGVFPLLLLLDWYSEVTLQAKLNIYALKNKKYKLKDILADV